MTSPAGTKGRPGTQSWIMDQEIEIDPLTGLREMISSFQRVFSVIKPSQGD